MTALLPKAAIFDFDGVLADSERLHWRTLAETLAAHDFPAVTWEQYQADLMGYDDRDAFRHATPDGTPDDVIAACVADKARRFAALAEAGAVPVLPGAAEAVRRCADAGLRLVLCSGALRSDLMPVLRQMGVDRLFTAIVTAEDVERSKPDPACYRLSLDRLALPTHDAVVFEDTRDGIAAARAADIPVIGIATHLPEAALLAAGARSAAPTLAAAVAALLG